MLLSDTPERVEWESFIIFLFKDIIDPEKEFC